MLCGHLSVRLYATVSGVFMLVSGYKYETAVCGDVSVRLNETVSGVCLCECEW